MQPHTSSRDICVGGDRHCDTVSFAATVTNCDNSLGGQTLPPALPTDEMPQGDPGILCFQHCDDKSKIFCLDLPDFCPKCDSSLTSMQLKSPPLSVPYPFTMAKKSPCCVVIKPSDGDFLHVYQNAADLHIGITNSRGEVHEYDKYGLNRMCRSTSWGQCLSIPIADEMTPTWAEYWDYTLDILCQMDAWQPQRYFEDTNNCYSFVLTFLRMLRVDELKPSLYSKTQFCKDFIVPRTKSAAKYIALYRRVIRDGVAVIDTL